MVMKRPRGTETGLTRSRKMDSAIQSAQALRICRKNPDGMHGAWLSFVVCMLLCSIHAVIN
ncbi:unnamed protein product [Fusarium venenatum]|uniref:Uncharacterized protein n=1 Tax=Fusarium venenatum TaxID=56646 RepID=A0A2L2T2L7_9HYPO|nr:uncharacterized protein FVRRES_01424 [Fusarium venenatum]CEI64912.1 unnamed protein product [Fusarium venenatum]